MRLLLVLFFLAASLSSGAFHAATAWDVRTTGSDTNGGGYQVGSTGTDRSQSNGPFQAYTDIVIGATTTQGTSVLFPFDATTVGNIINITGGLNCTVHRVQAVSQAAGVVTFDKSLGTAASVCTGNLGGSLATTTLAASLAVNGNTVWIQSGTYTVTATSTLGAGGVAGADVYEGYNAAHGDLKTAPLITTATNSTPLFTGSSSVSDSYVFRNVSFSNTAATRSTAFEAAAAGAATTTIYCLICSFDGFSDAILGNISRPLITYLYESLIKNSTTHAIGDYVTANIYGSFLTGNTGGITTSKPVTLVNSAIVAGTGVGISYLAGTVYISNSTIAGNSAEGVVGTTSAAPFIRNSIIYGNGTTGLKATSMSYIYYLRNNCVGGNTPNRSVVPVGVGDVTPLVDPFTNSAAGDYSLNSAATGGALCKGAGYPGLFPGGTTTSYPDIGAAQSSAAPSAVTHGSAFVQ